MVPGELDGIHGDRRLQRRNHGRQRVERVLNPLEDIPGDPDPSAAHAEGA